MSGGGSVALSRAALARVAAVILLVAPFATRAQGEDPFGPDWPAGEGRELTGAWCGGCHSLNLVRQQGLSRSSWDELLHWMSEKQNMPPLEGERRELVLDYLAANFGTGGAAPGAAGDPAGPPPLLPAPGIARQPLGLDDES